MFPLKAKISLAITQNMTQNEKHTFIKYSEYKKDFRKMTLVISVANPKGGTGKTTLAILLASEYATEHEVALVDASESKNLYLAMKRQAIENNKNPNIKVYAGSIKNDIAGVIETIIEKYKVIITDMPSQIESDHARYFQASNLVVIPTTIGEQETLEIRNLNDYLDGLQNKSKSHKKIPRIIVFNRVNMTHKNSPVFTTQKGVLKSLNYKIADTQISDRITYSFVTTSMGDLYSYEDKTSTKIIAAKKNIQDFKYDIEEYLETQANTS